MTSALIFDPIRLPPECEALRSEARSFLAEEISCGTFDPNDLHPDEAAGRRFALRVAARGWIGMTWPREYGGLGRSFLERYVLAEEFHAANAPVRHYFVADRQCGPMLLKYGSERLKCALLPGIIDGSLNFSIGMSEAGSGSDLFAAKAKATKTEGGWQLNGAKIWITHAHVSQYMIGMFRTSASTPTDRRHGLTSFVIDMRSPGIACHPITQMTGQREFNEVVFQDVFVPDDHLLGTIDRAADQATVELSYERSGPERFLETFYLLPELVDASGVSPDARLAEGLGQLVAQLHTLRRMSVSVAGMLETGKEPVVEAAIVKDLGTAWEQELPSRVRALAAFVHPGVGNEPALARKLAFATKVAPKLTLAGGTTEILRGIIARGLGIR